MLGDFIFVDSEVGKITVKQTFILPNTMVQNLYKTWGQLGLGRENKAVLSEVVGMFRL